MTEGGTGPADGLGAWVVDDVDFALLAYREEGQWEVETLPPRVGADLDTLVRTLHQRVGDGGVVGLVSVDEDFFVAVRVLGTDVRLLLSDVTAATEWPLARAVLDRLDIPPPEGEDEEHVQPAGDLGLLADLGVSTVDMAALCSELDLYPEEALGEVADRLGFGPAYARALDAVSP